jgi:hypothetical protein
MEGRESCIFSQLFQCKRVVYHQVQQLFRLSSNYQSMQFVCVNRVHSFKVVIGINKGKKLVSASLRHCFVNYFLSSLPDKNLNKQNECLSNRVVGTIETKCTPLIK